MFFFLKEFSICPQPFTQQFCSINVSCPRFQKVLQALSKLYYILNLCIAMIWFQLDVHFCQDIGAWRQFGLQKIMSHNILEHGGVLKHFLSAPLSILMQSSPGRDFDISSELRRKFIPLKHLTFFFVFPPQVKDQRFVLI